MDLQNDSEVLAFPAEKTATQAVRATLNRMTIYEKAHIIGVRASQLSDDAPPFVDIENMTDCIQIANKELEERKLPFIIRRNLPDGTFEDWPIDDLLIPDVDF